VTFCGTPGCLPHFFPPTPLFSLFFVRFRAGVFLQEFRTPDLWFCLDVPPRVPQARPFGVFAFSFCVEPLFLPGLRPVTLARGFRPSTSHRFILTTSVIAVNGFLASWTHTLVIRLLLRRCGAGPVLFSTLRFSAAPVPTRPEGFCFSLKLLTQFYRRFFFFMVCSHALPGYVWSTIAVEPFPLLVQFCSGTVVALFAFPFLFMDEPRLVPSPLSEGSFAWLVGRPCPPFATPEFPFSS